MSLLQKLTTWNPKTCTNSTGNMNNFTNNRWISVITLVLLTANIVTLALLWTNKKNEERPPQHPFPRGKQVFEFINRELMLDSMQRQTYKRLREEHQAGIRPLQDSIKNAKDHFFALLRDENVTESTIEEYSHKIGALEKQRDIVTFKHFQQLRALCTKEQQIKFDGIIREILHSMGGPKRPPGPPPEGMENENRRPPPPGE